MMDKDLLAAMEADSERVVPMADPGLYPVKGTPKTHQLRALSEAEGKEGFAWWMDPGAGKTFTAIADAGRLYLEGKIDCALVVAPLGPHAQWVTEQLPLWADFPWHGIHSKQPPGQKKKYFAQKKHGLAFCSINYDALRTPKGQEFIENLRALYPRMYLIVDESQKTKNPRAARTKEVLVLSLKAAYRRLLSGTPLLKGLEDLWSQYETVKPGLAWHHQPVELNRSGKGVNTYGYIGYRNHFCKLAPIPGNPRAVRIVGYRNEDELRDRVRPYSTRITADEFMKGEKPDIIPVHTPMTGEQQKQYNLMKDHLMALMDDGVLTAQNALVQMGKLSQIASGFLYREDGPPAIERGWQQFSTNKIDAAFDLLEQLDEPVILWVPFRALQQQLLIHLEDRNERKLWEPRPYFSGVDYVEHWKREPRGIIIGNQSSGLGVGMNLQHSAANIYLANSFSSEARWQSIKRTDRIGQTRQVRVWDLISPGTVDEKVMKALADKEEVSRRTIDGLKELM